MTENATAAPAGNAQEISGTVPATTETQTQHASDAATEQQSTQPFEQVQPGADGEQSSGETGTPQEQPASGDEQTETVEQVETKRNNVSAKERIQQLASRARAAEAERDRLVEQLEQIQQSSAPIDPLDFQTDAEYQQALIKQTVDATRAEMVRQQAITAQAQRQQAIRESWNEQADAFRANAPDFDQVAYSSPITNPTIAEAIMQSDAAAQVAYYLGKNHAEARALNSMNPIDAVMAIGRLTERLSAPLARKTTAAPPPPATIRGHGAPAQKSPENMTMEEYVAWRKGK